MPDAGSPAVVPRDRMMSLVALSVCTPSLRRTIGCTGLAISKPAAQRGKPTTARSSNGQEPVRLWP